LIVEGNIIEDLKSDSNRSFRSYDQKIQLVYDSLITIILDFKIPLVYTPNVEHTTNFLIAIANKLSKKYSYGPLLRKIRKQTSEQIQQLSVLSSLPGVGGMFAVKMLREYVRYWTTHMKMLTKKVRKHYWNISSSCLNQIPLTF